MTLKEEKHKEILSFFRKLNIIKNVSYFFSKKLNNRRFKALGITFSTKNYIIGDV